MHEKYDREEIIDLLSVHLRKIESVRNHILKEFYEEHTEERDNFESMVQEYSEYIRGIMDNKPNDTLNGVWPLVLIGSIVEVEDLDYSDIGKLKIVPPFYEDKNRKLECASCLSPVGHALLLKR